MVTSEFVFIHLPKTGGGFLSAAINRSMEARFCGPHLAYRHVPRKPSIHRDRLPAQSLGLVCVTLGLPSAKARIRRDVRQNFWREPFATSETSIRVCSLRSWARRRFVRDGSMSDSSSICEWTSSRSSTAIDRGSRAAELVLTAAPINTSERGDTTPTTTTSHARSSRVTHGPTLRVLTGRVAHHTGAASRSSRRRSRCSATVVERSRTSAREPGRSIERTTRSSSPSRTRGHAEAHAPDRLVRRAAVRARDAGQADRRVGAEALERAVGERLRDLLRDGAVALDQLGRHAEQLRLGLVRVGDHAAREVRRGAGAVGEARRPAARRCTTPPPRAGGPRAAPPPARRSSCRRSRTPSRRGVATIRSTSALGRGSLGLVRADHDLELRRGAGRS